jgi:hypothetical protein
MMVVVVAERLEEDPIQDGREGRIEGDPDSQDEHQGYSQGA